MGNTLLIVDGSETYREFLLEFFNKRDFSATGCVSHAAAQSLIAKQRFDVAVVDYFIGGTSGEEFCASLVASSSGQTALIVMSDRQTPDIERRIRGYAPAYYFVKPFAMDNLYAVVLKIIEFRDKKKLQMANHESMALKG